MSTRDAGEEDREAVEEHFRRFWGEVAYVLHPPISADDRHIDIHIIPPRSDDPHYTVFTTGMSEVAMNAPEGEPALVELMMRLPQDWHDTLLWEIPADAQEYWPINVIQYLARFPEQYETWLGHGHTVPNGDPPQPMVDGSPFTCIFVCDPPNSDRGFGRIALAEGRFIQVYALLPITTAEMNLCIEQGENPMLAALSDAGVGYVINAARKSVI